MNGDTPIKRKTFLEMSDAEQFAFIEALRERRMAPVSIYKEVQKAIHDKKQSKLKTQLEKQLEMFKKCLARCEKSLDDLQDRANKIQTLKIQIDIE